MKRLLFLVTVSLLSSSALADLYYVIPGHGRFYYVDMKSRLYENGMIDFWQIADIGDPENIGYINALADCKHQRMKLVTITLLIDGKSRSSANSGVKYDWERVTPGSTGEIALKAVCSSRDIDKWYKKTEVKVIKILEAFDNGKPITAEQQALIDHWLSFVKFKNLNELCEFTREHIKK